MPDYCAKTYRVHLSPTRTAIVGSFQEMSNRVIRQFVDNLGYPAESFIRVTVADENGDKLFPDDLSNEVCQRIKTAMTEGLQLMGRRYKFLAYSSSQLKECSMWMVVEGDSINVATVRGWMGDFSMCKTAPKLAARMGQCFSTTVAATKSSDRSQSTRLATSDAYPDVPSSFEDLPHSDGTGLINRSVLMDLVASFPSSPHDPEDVSIVQIRYGGAKGTVVAWDIRTVVSSPTYANKDVLLRPSMVKFKSEYNHLEIVGIGKQIPYYLNRHMIFLLTAQKVPDSVFHELQRTMLDSLDAMLRDPDRAMDMLPRLSGPSSLLTCTLIRMLSIGKHPEREPFLFSCLHAIRHHHLMNLRKKTRILVEKGAVLMGGLDETGLVPEGCVHIQIRTSGLVPEKVPKGSGQALKARFKVLTGPVLVAKHPVMHPGDVRMLMAVDIPELRQHKNVILFSKNGSRPETHKMAGSDLDGDQFAVTWDDRLFVRDWNKSFRASEGGGSDGNGSIGSWVSSRGDTIHEGRSPTRAAIEALERANFTPMEYDDIGGAKLAVAAALEPPGSSGRENQIVNHFVNFAKNDNLGSLANMWLDYAAKSGADCQQCLKIAKLSSIAVDFPKSGIPAQVPKELRLPRSTPRAHWRESKYYDSYHCTSIIGKLYDDVQERIGRDRQLIQNMSSIVGREITKTGQLLCFIRDKRSARNIFDRVYDATLPTRLGYGHHTHGDFLFFAESEQVYYEEALQEIMGKYGVHSEGEVLTGCIRKFHRMNKRRQHDLAEDVRRRSSELWKDHRQAFFWWVLDRICPQRLDEASEDWVVAEHLASTERVVTSMDDNNEFAENGFSVAEGTALRSTAFQLAAAFYMVAYSPEMQVSSHSVFFSFPWIVADVITAGIRSNR